MSKQTTVDYPIDPTMQNIEKQQCPVLFALNIIGQKWKLPLLWHLHIEKNTRYHALKRSIPGITKMIFPIAIQHGVAAPTYFYVGQQLLFFSSNQSCISACPHLISL